WQPHPPVGHGQSLPWLAAEGDGRVVRTSFAHEPSAVRRPGPSLKRSVMSTTTPPPVRLLIVDDDEALRQTLARRFQRLGMAVAEAADGEEALARAGHAAYDVALLDLHMPGMTGLE